MPLMVQTKATERNGVHELMAFVRSEIPTTSEEEVLSFVAQELGMTLPDQKLALADEWRSVGGIEALPSLRA